MDRPSPDELNALRRTLTVPQIAELFRVPPITVAGWLAELKPPAKPQTKPWREGIGESLDRAVECVMSFLAKDFHEPKDLRAQADLAVKAIPVLTEIAKSVPTAPAIDRDALLEKARKLTASAVKLRVVA